MRKARYGWKTNGMVRQSWNQVSVERGPSCSVHEIRVHPFGGARLRQALNPLVLGNLIAFNAQPTTSLWTTATTARYH